MNTSTLKCSFCGGENGAHDMRMHEGKRPIRKKNRRALPDPAKDGESAFYGHRIMTCPEPLCQHAGARNGSLIFCAAGGKWRPDEDCELCVARVPSLKDEAHENSR
ncbi:MAG: hypothetical protein WC436_06540 [Candidatus Babeliales bacterium]